MDQLGVSRTTVTRDFEYLRDFLDAPIVYDREENGHHYDPGADAFELPGFWLNQSELFALLATEQLLEAAQPGLLAPYLGPLKSRVRKLLGQGGQGADLVSRRIRLVDTGRRGVAVDDFAVVAEAVLTARKLAFRYHGRARDRQRHRTTHPQRLIHYRNNWYLVAHCETADDLRIFSLDRIRDASMLADSACRVADATLDRAVEASYGIFSGSARGWAVLRFSPEAARWVAEERWHPDQIGTWSNGGYELQVPYSDPTELIMEILRHGTDVEVLAPVDLRGRVARKLREAADQYC